MRKCTLEGYLLAALQLAVVLVDAALCVFLSAHQVMCTTVSMLRHVYLVMCTLVLRFGKLHVQLGMCTCVVRCVITVPVGPSPSAFEEKLADSCCSAGDSFRLRPRPPAAPLRPAPRDLLRPLPLGC